MITNAAPVRALKLTRESTAADWEAIAADPGHADYSIVTDWWKSIYNGNLANAVLAFQESRAIRLAKSAQAPPVKPSRRRRLWWVYAPLPLPILWDGALSARAIRAAAAIARAGVSTRKDNPTLTVELTYAQLAAEAGIHDRHGEPSAKTAERAVSELRKSGHLDARPIGGRAGCLFTFTEKCGERPTSN